jgi:hypothetical protein
MIAALSDHLDMDHADAVRCLRYAVLRTVPAEIELMRLLNTTIARYAELAPDSTFNIVGGGFVRIRVSEFPVTVPTLALLIKLAADVHEHGDYRLAVVLVDPHETQIAGGASELTFKVDEDPDHRELTCLFQMFGVQFQRPGVHCFRITLGEGTQLGTEKLSVELPTGVGNE